MTAELEARIARLEGVIVPIVAVLVAMVIGMILIFITGNDPLQAYGALIKGAVGSPSAITGTIIKATPLVLTGLAVAFAFRAGMFNIGANGQLIVGMITAGAIAIALDGLPWMLHATLATIGAAMAGAVWAGIAGWLKATRGAHEVITTIMLNYIAIRLGEYLLSPGAPLQDASTSNPQSVAFPDSAGYFILFKPEPATVLHSGTLLAIGIAVLAWFILDRTTLGYRIRTVGMNEDAARYSGISVTWTLVLTMLLAGAFAGLAGATLALGDSPYKLSKSDFAAVQVGFTGIAVALLGRGTVPGVVVAALLFGALDSSTTTIQFEGGLPSGQGTKLIEIIQGLVVFFVGMDLLFRHRVRGFLEKRMAPGAAGAGG